MPGLYNKYIKLINSVGDTITMTVAAVAAHGLVYGNPLSILTTEKIYTGIVSLGIWFLCSSLSGTYKFYRVRKVTNVIVSALKVLILYVLLTQALLNIFDTGSRFSQPFLVTYYLLLLVLIVAWRVSVVKIMRLLRRRGYNNRRVIIVGFSEAGKLLKEFFENHPEYGYHFKGFFDDHAPLGQEGVVGRISDVEEFTRELTIDEIYCCPSRLDNMQLQRLVDFVDDNLVRMKLITDFGGFQSSKLKLDFYNMLPVLIMRPLPLDDAINKVFKRAFDIFFSLTVIVFLLSWLLPILAVIIKLTSSGPVFFKQTRSGIDNKDFQCYKLRSMYVNKEANLLLARRGDSRITPVGAFLRKTSLDELPQFFNVLLGHMSIVGPRPHMLKLGEEYAQVAEKYMVRHFIKPGVTGLSQVRGYRGDTTALYQIRGRTKLDIFYLENWSFLLDLKIIYYTVYNAVKGDEAAF
ncbi:undecaprenyl-phosphate galactose phosphotransferase/putative colanic acid biosynthesis UDP-glucose lipid carrier transferase [Pontibacter ummariensis]|uniref:Undecaprenyl-phosphate galactose phosphotransferase/putative colanic acid biosysnthesis UDP-glucose lipid carrier transferase n=1 Tax=Pontibacter ummariensis TaxID=1610492 RepID=A0A239FD77_9BACT|nr:undecaprenyl-phosphate glucose phosphotransferase [Pontibacter ummariensis]PRY12307.1 undecaprenyl-phosphate galactose phosphotransferase/putative colanic acid biosynthesis UDP-glucose lipid carrier transferase [Pontibacter ummariensis]SNS54889.1 undecaprenyl-phosphate galactose phosphotransferase/putative colanic acid biosysnthesis UDP-glucose lipid carrier transferase [Pontibacter ummariensis]